MAPSAPLVLKEIRVVARDPRSYVLRTAFAAAAALVVVVGWRQAVERNVYTVSGLAQIGRGLFAGLAAIQTLFALFAGALLGAGSVSGEIRRGTLPLLFLASLEGRSIARAKAFSSALQALGVLLCGTPLMAACAFLGGAGPVDLAGAAALALAAAALGAACGVDASARTPAGGSAALRALGGLALYGAAAAGLAFATLGIAAAVLPFFHVYAALIAFLTPGFPGAGIAPFTTLLASLAFALWRLRRAEKLLSRSVHPPVLPSETPRDLVGLDAVYRRGRRRLPGVWDDAPILWKELATRPIARLSLFGRLFGLVALAALALPGAFFADVDARGYFFFLWTIYAGLALTAGALLFEPERTQRQWETLLTTPLGRGEFLRRKIAAGLASPEVLCLGGLAAATVLVWGLRSGPVPLLGLALTSAAFLPAAFCVGAAASLHARSLPAAWSAAAAVVAFLVWGLELLPGGAALSPWSLIERSFLAGRRLDGALAAQLLAFPLAQAVLLAGIYGLGVRRLRECPGVG